MSLSSEVANYKTYLGNAWDALETAGATIPENKNLENVSEAVGGLKNGIIGNALIPYEASGALGNPAYTYDYVFLNIGNTQAVLRNTKNTVSTTDTNNSIITYSTASSLVNTTNCIFTYTLSAGSSATTTNLSGTITGCYNLSDNVICLTTPSTIYLYAVNDDNTITIITSLRFYPDNDASYPYYFSQINDNEYELIISANTSTLYVYSITLSAISKVREISTGLSQYSGLVDGDITISNNVGYISYTNKSTVFRFSPQYDENGYLESVNNISEAITLQYFVITPVKVNNENFEYVGYTSSANAIQDITYDPATSSYSAISLYTIANNNVSNLTCYRIKQNKCAYCILAYCKYVPQIYYYARLPLIVNVEKMTYMFGFSARYFSSSNNDLTACGVGFVGDYFVTYTTDQNNTSSIFKAFYIGKDNE